MAVGGILVAAGVAFWRLIEGSAQPAALSS
jgi:hypothetical protein